MSEDENFEPDMSKLWNSIKKLLSHGAAFGIGLIVGGTGQAKAQPSIPDGHRKILADIEVEINGKYTRNFSDLTAPYIKVFQHNRLEQFGTQEATENVLVGMDDMETQFDNWTDILIQITNNPELKEEGYQGWDMDVICTGALPKDVYFRGKRILSYPSAGHYRFLWVIPPP